MSAHVTERLGLFLDGEIPAEERAVIAGHLRECAACAKRLEELAAVDDVARSLTVEAPEGYFDAFPSRVRGRLRAPAKRRFTPPAWSLAVAAALILAVLTPLTLRQIRAPSPSGSTEVPAAAPVAAGPASAQRQPAQAEPEAKRALKDAPASAALEKRRSVSGAAIEAPTPGPALTMAPAPAPTKEETGRDEAAPAARPAPMAPPASTGMFAGAPADGREQDALRRKGKAARADADAAQESLRMRTPAEEGALGGRGVTANAAPAAGAAELRYQALLARKAATVAEARSLREAWGAYVQSDPGGPHADEARVSRIEAGVSAYRLSGDADDRAAAERDAADYLARPDARQAARVRAILASVEPH